MRTILNSKHGTKKFWSLSGTAGFTLVEIIVAAGIISLSVVAIIAIASQSISFSRQSLDTYTAATMLEEGAEAVRTVRDSNWGVLAALSPDTSYYPTFSTTSNSWSLSTEPADAGMFARTVTVAPVSRNAGGVISATGTDDPGTRLVTVTVTWREHDTPQSKSLSFYLSNIL